MRERGEGRGKGGLGVAGGKGGKGGKGGSEIPHYKEKVMSYKKGA